MNSRSRRGGFTLLEIVLVTVVLLIFGAVAYPTLRRSYGAYKLQGGIDSVRAAWSQARARAIEEGRPYRFSVEPGGSHYRVAPDRDDYWSGSAPSNDPQGKGYILEESLPGGVQFSVNGESNGPPRDDSSMREDKKVNYSGMNWNTTVVFLPDGTAKDNVRIQFNVRGVKPTMVQLRGLTGTVTVTPVKN